MNEDEIRDAVTTALADAAPHIDATVVAPTADFHEELELDSLDFLQLVERLAELTGVEVPERDYGELTSIETTAAYVGAHQTSAAT